MKTTIVLIIALILSVLIGFGIWYAFIKGPGAYPANPASGETRLPEEPQQPSRRETATSSAPILESRYDVEHAEFYTALSITLIPTKLGREPMDGIEIALWQQQPPLPEPYQVIINANITGDLQKEWTCEAINKLTVRCGGATPLALGESTVLALYFNRPPVMPERIGLSVLHGGTAIAVLEAARRDE